MTNRIAVLNRAQAAIMECEMKGQISDGCWENSKPHNHYEIMCDAEVVVDPVNPGLNFRPKRGYNFANKDLLDIVGERTIDAVRCALAFPNLEIGEADGFPMNGREYSWIEGHTIGDKPIKHFVERLAQVNSLGITSAAEAEAFGETAPVYTRKDLVKDCKVLSRMVSAARAGRKYVPKAPKLPKARARKVSAPIKADWSLTG